VASRIRLKPYNAGGALPLLEGELFKLSWFPMSRGVHQVKIIGGSDQFIEYGEYLVIQGASHFIHSWFKMADQDAATLRSAIATLEKHAVPLTDDDSIEPERRILTIWVGGQRRAYSMAPPHLREQLEIHPRYEAAFEGAWRAVVDVVSARRRVDFGSNGAA
jgi:hypothetical protein